MFSFFTKKEFLVDHLEGFVDVHNHILPGIDDGAKNVEESIELLKGFAEFGVQDFICTPHIMDNYYPNTPTFIGESLSQLKNGLKMNDLKGFNIQAAAEHMIDAKFETILDENNVMPLDKKYLLVEMSYLQASLNFNTAVEKIAKKNYYPILAHPERYAYLHSSFSKYTSYKRKGILFQLNMLSLGAYYGKHIQKMAFKLLEENLIDFIATDVHNKGQLNYLKNLTVTNKILDKIKPLAEKTCYNFL